MEDSIKQYLVEAKVLAEYDVLEESKDDLEQAPKEIFEYWLVTHWMCEQLKAKGEPVLDNDYGYWWGRTCSGQQISADHVIHEIACSISHRRN